MSKYTAELRTIIDNGFNIFDFGYERTEESQNIISNEQLQNDFIDHFYFEEVGFETLERFKKRLATQWRESLFEFDRLLVAYNKDFDPLANTDLTTKSRVVFNDTPKSKLDPLQDYATTITDNESNVKGYSGNNASDLLQRYYNGLHDIETEFFESFQNLFMGVL